MGHDKYAEILHQGVTTWNNWRKANPRLKPELEGKLDSVALRTLRRNPTPKDMQRLTGRGRHALTEFSPRADLTGVDFSNASLEGEDMTLFKLAGANFDGALLSQAQFEGTILRNSHFRDAHLRNANFKDADLRGAHLSEAYLLGVDFRGAELAGADFTGAQVWGTIFGNNDLSKVKGLDTVRHSGPSTIGVDTLYRSNGEIPQDFLRGAGVPEDLIVYMKSLVANPIEFYSCFISYSSRDQDFAERLHSELQAKRVRCWLATEDLKIGDRFGDRIEESIRLYDKLLLVLSHNSIASEWVEREVQAAFEKEQRRMKLVLFPIRLDDCAMKTDRAWAANIRRTRHIGDFRNWKNHDVFKKSFKRLLRDLKKDFRSLK